MTEDPLLATLQRLREIDADYVKRHPYSADDEIARRMRDLRLVVTALDELNDRGEAATPDAVRAEMAMLSSDFVFQPALLLELEDGFLDDGDTANAETVRQAFDWTRLMASRSSVA